MKDIIIVCAGGFGCEVYDLILDINEFAKEQGKSIPYNILGFLSDVPVDLKIKGIDANIIGDIQSWQPNGSEVYALGISNPSSKVKLAGLLKNKGAKFETIINPRSHIGRNVQFGEGCIVSPYTLGRGVILGDFVNIMGSMVGDEAIIGDYSTTTGFSNITNSHLGKRVFVGSGAVIMNNKKIGDDVFISACSLVVSNLKTGKRVFGVPAKSFNL